MKLKIGFLLLFLSIFLQPSFAQKAKKPQVLVYGTDFLAFSAAVQSARSGVPTLWFIDADQPMAAFFNGDIRMETLPHVDGGVWMEMLMDMALSEVADDSLAALVKRDMSPRLFQNAVEKILTKLPQLTVKRSEDVVAIARKRKGWAVKGSSRNVYTVRAVIDASEEQKLADLAGIVWDREPKPLPRLDVLSVAALRTVVASGQVGDALYAVPLSHLLAGENNGFFNFRSMTETLSDDLERTPFCAAVGQAVGATAAYLAFFKTSADGVDVRKLQTELMSYDGRMLPFQEINRSDPNFYALQRFGLAGILTDLHTEAGFLFRGDEPVSYAAVQPVFDRLYTRSQLWFLDHKGTDFRWNDFLSLIKYVGLRGDDIQKQIADDWTGKLGFTGSFDPEDQVSRYQFAVVLDKYANPYVKAVNKEGVFLH